MANQGDCAPGYPQGASWLNWWGYFALSWGQTDGWMDYYSASGTITRSSGHNSDQGVDGNALVNLSASWDPGTWAVSGSHTASFFSGTQLSTPFYFTC